MFHAYEHYPPFRPSALKSRLASGAPSRIPYADAATNETEYTYDLLGRVLTVTDPRGKVTSYVYNGFGDVIQETSPDRGTWVWYYDKARNVTQQIDGNSVTTNMTYDAADRILTRSYPADSSLDVDYTYDETGHGEGIGRLTSVTDQAGTLSLDYDERGLVTAQERVISGNTYTTGFTYESAGRYSSVTYPDAGWVISYARDNAGQVSGVTATEPGQSPVNVATSITYLPFGPVSGLTHGNGLVATFTHDLDYRTTGIRYASAGGNIYYTSNTWNANNNLTNIVDNVNATNNQDLTYDVIDRLTYASSGSYTSSSITYDSNSNRLTYGGTSYTIDSASNRMTAAGGTSITYTSAGNISAIGSDTLVYNKANQLATATVSGTASAYVYDAFGQRLTSTVGAGTPVIQQYGMGGLLLSETQGAAETNYVYLNGMPIASINTASPAISYVHTNHLGTPQKATNSGQSVVWSGAYQPFGAVTPTTSITQNLRFPGQYADPTGFNYNMYRNYNPALGRYLESDPIGLAGGINTYNYAANNPYKFIDPLGLDTQYSGSFGATLGVIYWGIGGSVSLGINVPDDPKNIDGYQVFGSAQGNAMVGVGVFAGFGVGLGKSTSDGPLPVLDGQLSAYAEANIGIGKSIGGSVQAPLTVAECTANNPNGTVMSANRGYSVGAPIPKGGEGVGFWVGAGPAASGTIATPTPKRVKEYFNRVNP